MPCKVTWGSSRCGQEVERSEGKAQARAFIWACVYEKGKAGQEKNSLGIGQIEECWQAMGYKVGLQLSGTWSWVIQSRGYIGLVCVSQIEMVVEGLDLRLVDLHMKSGLTNKVLTVSRNQLALGGAVSLQPARPPKDVITS